MYFLYAGTGIGTIGCKLSMAYPLPSTFPIKGQETQDLCGVRDPTVSVFRVLAIPYEN